MDRRVFLQLAGFMLVVPELPKAKTLMCGVDVALGPGSYTMTMVECFRATPTYVRYKYKIVGSVSGRIVSGYWRIPEKRREYNG